MQKLIYPGGKRFAFSVFDDTDVATLDSIRPLYDYLHQLGMRTTKTVWSLDYDGTSDFQGSHTLEHAAYADYVRELHQRGFEIGFHGATMESAKRADIVKSFDAFASVVGEPPAIYAAHGLNRDNLYWGVDRLGFKATRWLYSRLRGEQPGYFQGNDPDSDYFWGDLAQQHLKYMRSFTFTEINLLNLRLPLVYRRADTPWVRRWFISSDAENVQEFNALLDSRHQQALEEQRGLCIVSTHFGKGFVEDDEVHPVTKNLLKALSERDGWFAPVSEILAFYCAQAGCPELDGRSLLAMELKWFADSIKRRLQNRDYEATESLYLDRAKLEKDRAHVTAEKR